MNPVKKLGFLFVFFIIMGILSLKHVVMAKSSAQENCIWMSCRESRGFGYEGGYGFGERGYGLGYEPGFEMDGNERGLVSLCCPFFT